MLAQPCDQNDKLIDEHTLYSDLGSDVVQRCKRYIEMFNESNTVKQDSQISTVTHWGEVYGGDAFQKKISAQNSNSIWPTP